MFDYLTDGNFRYVDRSGWMVCIIEIILYSKIIFVEAWCYFWKVESNLASLIYDTRTDLHQNKLKHSRQTTETVKTC